MNIDQLEKYLSRISKDKLAEVAYEEFEEAQAGKPGASEQASGLLFLAAMYGPRTKHRVAMVEEAIRVMRKPSTQPDAGARRAAEAYLEKQREAAFDALENEDDCSCN
jgi:hypothetical protein